jgi:hypothetical protein
MQVNIIEVKTKIKNVNTYNESSLFINLQDNEPNRNSNQLNCVPIVYHIEQNKVKCNLYETLTN